ncbi:MAG: M28 family peptidase [Candidatus Omnitrophica bacterium]|nr:M28 family peptidase [Candidatus Omnitrophota bacterium]MBU1995584.1 M28 family peptidase [Candidatus Omnitrophota bacterium]
MSKLKINIPSKIFSFITRAIIVYLIIMSTTYGWSKEEMSKAHPDIKNNLKSIVYDLSENIGTRNYANYKNLEKTTEFIINKFNSFGYMVKIMEYEVNGQVFKNVIAENPTHVDSDDIYIIGAHYDSCFNPGADDNASGIAGLIELGRLLKEEKLSKRIRFIAFVNEEPPFFMTDNMGSRVYTRQLKDKKENIKAAIILEMIGYYSEEKNSQRYPPLIGPFFPNKGNYIAVVGNINSRKLLKKVVKNFKSSSDFPMESIVVPGFISGFNFSDHWSFWKEDYPAVMITDTAFHRNKNYHKETDLPGTLDYSKMAEVVLGLKGAVIKLVNENKGKKK